MPRLRLRLLALALTLLAWTATSSLSHSAPVPVIFDTDMAEDVDDVGALAVLHALADRGECELLGVMICARNEAIGPCVDAINRWYGRPGIPIGYQRSLEKGYRKTDPAPTPSKYVERIAAEFPHELRRSSDAPDAAQLYRRLLAARPDRSVTIVSVGFLNNLQDLLDSPKDDISPLTGEQLVKAKVREWVCMGGRFPKGQFDDGGGEYNVMYDTTASVRAIHDWPTPVVFSGFEIGVAIKTGGSLQGRPGPDPIQLGYRLYTGGPARESWDLTAVLYAVRGLGDRWTLSEAGLCLMHQRVPHGYNEWIPQAGRNHRYLVAKAPPAQVAKELEDLLLAPPQRPQAK